MFIFLISCSPIIKTHGYTIENTKDFTEFVKNISLEKNPSKDYILSELGSPSIIIDNVDNIWIYLLSTKRERSFSDSEIEAQFIIRLEFNDQDLLINKKILTGKDFNKISFSTNKTKRSRDSYGITDQFIDAFTRGN